MSFGESFATCSSSENRARAIAAIEQRAGLQTHEPGIIGVLLSSLARKRCGPLVLLCLEQHGDAPDLQLATTWLHRQRHGVAVHGIRQQTRLFLILPQCGRHTLARTRESPAAWQIAPFKSLLAAYACAIARRPCTESGF